MSEEKFAELLVDVKNHLDITWIEEDGRGDEKLSGMIKRSMNRLDEIAGEELDYEEEAKPRELLFTRVMYDRSGGLDDFAENYKPDLIGLRIGKQVERHAKDKEQEV